jgi:hypothetical protein
MEQETEKNLMRQGRLTAMVIVGSMFFWIFAQWIGPQFGLAGRYAILADLIALASLFWALVNCFFYLAQTPGFQRMMR